MPQALGSYSIDKISKQILKSNILFEDIIFEIYCDVIHSYDYTCKSCCDPEDQEGIAKECMRRLYKKLF